MRLRMTAGTDADTFEIQLAGATVVFSRDSSGQVVGLVLHQAAVARDIEAERLARRWPAR